MLGVNYCSTHAVMKISDKVFRKNIITKHVIWTNIIFELPAEIFR